MNNIQQIARQAAQEAHAEHSSSGGKHETISAVADAVAVAVLREMKKHAAVDYIGFDHEEHPAVSLGAIDNLLAAFTPAEPPQQEIEVLRAPTTEASTVADPRGQDRAAEARAAIDGEPARASDDLTTEPPWCSRYSADGWICTRHPGHEGEHVAGNSLGDTVYSRWPRAGTVQELSRASVTPSASAAPAYRQSQGAPK